MENFIWRYVISVLSKWVGLLVLKHHLISKRKYIKKTKLPLVALLRLCFCAVHPLEWNSRRHSEKLSPAVTIPQALQISNNESKYNIFFKLLVVNTLIESLINGLSCDISHDPLFWKKTSSILFFIMLSFNLCFFGFF